MPKQHWTASFFDKNFYEPSNSFSMAKAKEEISFIIKKCGLKKGAAVLDIACGQGRHSVELAKKGMHVLGIDITEAYLNDAKKLAKKNKAEVYFEKADMREINFKESFDCALIMFTSFGYFTKSENIKVLKNAFNALKKGGMLLIDVLDDDFLKANNCSRFWHELPGGQHLLEERFYNPKKQFCRTVWTRVGYKYKPQTRVFELHTYNEKTLRKLLETAGFKFVNRFYALNEKEQGDKTQNRLVITVKK